MKKNIIFLLFLFSITAIYALDKPTIMVKSNGYEQIENETKSCLQEYGYKIVEQDPDYIILITNYFSIKGGIIINFSITNCLTNKVTRKSVSYIEQQGSTKGKNITKKIIEFLFQEKWYS
ncbi:MAG TPA: hypothetical protein PLM63_02215 [bacterium]|nr:hypothetical protein [bacterium]HPO11371.1 hypothetical protein [bacterium]HQL12121.1 hypothetical protein [bacterium]